MCCGAPKPADDLATYFAERFHGLLFRQGLGHPLLGPTELVVTFDIYEVDLLPPPVPLALQPLKLEKEKQSRNGDLSGDWRGRQGARGYGWFGVRPAAASLPSGHALHLRPEAGSSVLLDTGKGRPRRHLQTRGSMAIGRTPSSNDV